MSRHPRITTTLLALLVAAGCASERLAADAGDSETSDGPSETDGSSMFDADEQLCIDWCLSGNANECSSPWAGELCFTRCMTLELDPDDPCLAEHREVLACEAGSPSSRTAAACETVECVEAYKRHDLCRGSCSHLGGSQGAGGSPDTCEWRSSCYGQQFEARCSVGLDPTPCECFVDDELVASCEQAGALPAFACDEDLHVLTTCCGATFEPLLLP